MEKLPKCHVSLIRHVMCVLYHVSLRSDENQMTSMNLGICVGPSMLWPSVCADMAAQADAAKKVPLFIQFIIDHFQEVSAHFRPVFEQKKSLNILRIPLFISNTQPCNFIQD